MKNRIVKKHSVSIVIKRIAESLTTVIDAEKPVKVLKILPAKKAGVFMTPSMPGTIMPALLLIISLMLAGSWGKTEDIANAKLYLSESQNGIVDNKLDMNFVSLTSCGK